MPITLQSFIESLNISKADAYCSFLELPSRKPSFFHTYDTKGIVKNALDNAKTQNVYMSIALFPSPPETGRGKAEDVSHLIGFFADIDTMEKPDPKHNYAPDKQTALKILEEVPFKPTYIMDSGYGLHVLWLYYSPLELKDSFLLLTQTFCL